MTNIEIDLTKVCPYLVANYGGTKLTPVTIDLETNTSENDTCEVGGKLVESDIESDLMVERENIEVKVRCKGCKLRLGGFSKTVTAKAKP